MEKIIGLTPIKIEQTSEQLVMYFSDGTFAEWQHTQDCCETVEITDVNGDWNDLIGVPLLVADERTSDNEKPLEKEYIDDTEWTFYTFRSIDGSVDVRWCGTSNGYYSTSVDFFHGKLSED